MVEPPGHQQRLTVVREEAQPLRMIRWKQGCGAAEQVRRRRDVTASERAASGRREAASAVLADRAPAVVERAELREVAARLLEVVAEDLLELGATVAVHLVRPRDEPLVQVGAGALEDRVVGGVADHDVLEPVLSVVAVLDVMDEVLLGERRQLRAHPRRHLRRREGADRRLGEDVPDDRGGLDHGALAVGESVEASREQCLDGGRDVQLVERAGGVPAAVSALEGALVDEHAEQLLREERVPLGSGDDTVEDLGLDGPTAQHRLDHRSAGLGVERLAARCASSARRYPSPGSRRRERASQGRR